MSLTGGAAILARLRNQRQATATPSLVIAYASQTGTAQDIAQTINGECNERSIKSKVLSLNDLKFENVSASKTPLVICVIASTGDGDAPDNSQVFFKDMKQARVENAGSIFKRIKYTCLGLGDSNYTSFMFVPRLLKKGFDELGAELFYDYKEVDEVDGLEELTDQWIENLWDPLKAALFGAGKKEGNETHGTETSGSKSVKTATVDFTKSSNRLSDFLLPSDLELQGVPALPVTGIEVTLHESMPTQDPQSLSTTNPSQRFLSEIKSVRKLTADWSDREVYLMTFDVEGSGLTFSPGDSLDIMPQNDPEVVAQLLDRLQVNGDLFISVSSVKGMDKTLPHTKPHFTVRDCFLHGVEFASVPKKSLLRFLAHHCKSDDEKHRMKFLVSKMGKEAYQKFILSAKISLLDILLHFSSCQPPLAGLLDLLPPLAPRMYSIANSPKANPKEIRIAFSLTKYETPTGLQTGVATSWLKKLSHGFLDQRNGLEETFEEQAKIAEVQKPRVGVCIRSGGAFHAPSDLSKPWILIGPGTGIAPFLGFLEERKHIMTGYTERIASCWVFFGCRRDDEDFLFKSELESLKNSGVITHFHVAFSRQTDSKVYVQHLMKLHSTELYTDIHTHNGFIFVCGDGTQMAQDVHKCLIEMIMQEGNVNEDQSTTWLNQKLQDQTYVRDIWS